MPGTITHNYVLYKAISTYSASSPLLKQVQDSHVKVCEHAQKGLLKRYYDADCLLGACAYLGCFGPDLFYLERSTGTFIADLMHYNRSGPFMMWCLRKVKQSKMAVEAGLRNDLMRQFAYYLGYASHIAADVSVHPLTNSIASAYPDNKKLYENAGGWVGLNLWRFHNIVEHYADSYVLYRRFFDMEKFGRNWETVNIARAAAVYFLNKAHKGEQFLRTDSQNYYHYSKAFGQSFEDDKYKFFESSNHVININVYYQSTIPSQSTMSQCPSMAQGGAYNPDGSLAKPGLLDRYIDDAIQMTKTFWEEVEQYLDLPQNDFEDPQFKTEKQCFSTLRRHWNLDCGISPEFDLWTSSWEVPGKPKTTEDIAGALRFVSSHRELIDDIA